MDNTYRIADILIDGKIDTHVCVRGWVRTNRELKDFCFIELNDGSCLANIQIVADKDTECYDDAVKLTTGSSTEIKGVLVESLGKGQKYEIKAESIQIYCISPSDFPLQKKRHSFEYLRQIAHLRPRTNVFGAITRIRSSLSFAVHSFFNERGFQYIHTPIITASDCEGAGEMFKVTTLDLDNIPKDEHGKVDYQKDFFGRPANLTVSGQLEGEIYATALGKIYTFGPTFRAENSNTPRHLAEFWMIEPEMAFCDLNGDMDVAEEFVRYLAKWILDKNIDDINLFNLRVEKTVTDTLKNIANNPFERISYTEAIKILKKNNANFDYKVSWGSDIQTEHERFLSEDTFNKPVIVYDYPKEIKAFYMKQNSDGKTVRAMDVLVPRIGELIGGSEREDNYDVLRNKIRENNLNEKDYWWYLDLRKFGGVPHSGFGLGFERLILLATGMQNIKDVIPFPRTPGNAEF